MQGRRVDPQVRIDPDLDDDRAAPARRPGHLQTNRPGASVTTVGAVAIGGVAGALARYGIETALPVRTGQFPWATFLINVTGSLVLGFLVPVLFEHFAHRRLLRPLLGTGLIGAFTTFSTFTDESVQLARHGDSVLAAGYVVASLAAGLAAGLLGMLAARRAAPRQRTTAERAAR